MAALVQRQLPNLLSGLFPSPHDTQTTDPPRSAGLTSSQSVTSTNSISSTTSVISFSQASSPTLTESSVTPSSTISSSTSETSTTSPTPTSVPIEATSADGSTVYTTDTPSASPNPSVQAIPANTSNGFLQNKALSGIVFAIVGVVVLVLIVAITTIALRRSKKKRLHDEAVSFDPAFLGGSQLDRDSVEKRRFSLLSSDNGHGGMGGNLGRGGYIPSAPPPAAYTRPDPYHFPTSESQHSLVDQTKQPWYGGATFNGPYGVAQAPQSDLRPAWTYGHDLTPVPPSRTPSPPDRAKNPESAPYFQAGHLKIANA